MSFTFVAAGGTTPYVFSVSGNGTINSSTGKYTAAELPGSDAVKVTDHDGVDRLDDRHRYSRRHCG